MVGRQPKCPRVTSRVAQATRRAARQQVVNDTLVDGGPAWRLALEAAAHEV